MNPIYSDLNGTYDTLDEIKYKISKLHNDKIFSEIQEISWNDRKELIGKCRQCSNYNLNSTNGSLPNFVHTGRNLYARCQKCSARLHSKWNNVRVFNSKIYVFGEARFPEGQIIGHFRFLMDNKF